MDVNEKDWKLFRKYLPDWQEKYMEKLIKDYIEFLKGDGLASDKFWELEKKIKADRKNPGVLLQDVRRSNFHVHLASLVGYEVISMKDLDGFSDETKEIVERMVRWVQIEAYSVEDKGRGISFNVFCYNVQPGVDISYADGSNKLSPDAENVADKNSFTITGGDSGNGSLRSSAGNEVSDIPAGITYVVNKNSGKFHYPSCDSVNDMKEKNKEYSTKTRDEFISEGKSPCKRCRP